MNKFFNNSTLFYFILFLTIIYPILFIFQCGDLTDLGYYAYNYSTFQELLQDGRTNSSFFLTNVIGSFWLKLFPNLGIIGLKLLYLIFLYSIQLISYQFVGKFIANRLIIIFSIFIVVVFSERWLMLAFQYDISSWFFMLISMVLLSFSLINNIKSNLFLSGMIFTFAFLSKISSLGFIMLLPIILFYYQYKCNKISLKKIAYKLLIFYSGILFSIILFFYLFDLADIYLKYLPFTNQAEPISKAFSFKTQLHIYFTDLGYFIITTILVYGIIFFFSLLFLSHKFFKFFLCKLVLILFIGVLFGVYFYGKDFSYFNPIKYLMPALCFPPLIFSILTRDKVSNISLIFIVASINQVLGTNTGLFLKMGYSFYILLPLSLTIILNQKFLNISNIKFDIREMFIVVIIFISGVSFMTRLGWIYNVDESLYCRFNAIYTVKHPLMRGILTTKNRSLLIQKTSGELNYFLKNTDRHLFIYGHQPLFYYLTYSISPIDNIWLWNHCTEIEELLFQIRKSYQKNGSWPVILDTNENILGDSSQILFDQFLFENNFILVENNPSFKIWVPQ